MKLKYLTALYSSLDQEYNRAMSGPYEDLSYHGDDCKVIAGLKDGRISGYWRPVVALGDDKGLKLHIERLFNICSNIYYLDFLINGQLSVISQFLLRHGHTARPYYTQIIDLTKSEKELHAGLRKSYKSLVSGITKGRGFEKVKDSGFNSFYIEHILLDRDWIVDGEDGIWPDIQKLHEELRGKVTRNNESWQVQAKMLNTGEAYLTYSGQKDKGFVCAMMFYFNQDWAYYAMSASKVPAHPAMWKAILFAKELGCKTFEMGEQVFDVGAPMMERGKLATKKDVDISLFKRGFGGRTQTRLILER